MYFGKELKEKKFYDEERVKRLYSNIKIPHRKQGKSIKIDTHGGNKNSSIIGHNIKSQISGIKGLDILKETLGQNEEKSQLIEDIIDVLVLKGKMRSKNDNCTINLDTFLEIVNQVSRQLKHEEFILKNSHLAKKVPFNKDYLNCIYTRDRELIKKYASTKEFVEILRKRDENRSAKTNLTSYKNKEKLSRKAFIPK